MPACLYTSVNKMNSRLPVQHTTRRYAVGGTTHQTGLRLTQPAHRLLEAWECCQKWTPKYRVVLWLLTRDVLPCIGVKSPREAVSPDTSAMLIRTVSHVTGGLVKGLNMFVSDPNRLRSFEVHY